MGRPAVKIGVIIQARMGSTRLPGKVLQSIAGRPLLDHIFGRLNGLHHTACIVVATSDTPRDNIVATFCDERGVNCFRGSEEDVLARYYECARQQAFDHVVRITGDNPFPDVDELDRLIALHIVGNYDYCDSFGQLPVGVGAEIFTFAALERSFLEGHAPHHREHVDEYILENRDLFRCGCLSIAESKRHPEVRLTVDTAEDLQRAQFIAEHTTGPWTTTEEAIALCSRFV